MAGEPWFSKRDRDPAARRHRRRSDEGGARESFGHARRELILRAFLYQGKLAKRGNWGDNPHRVVGENRDGAISLRLPVAKLVENNHQFTLALRFERFKDLKPVDIMVYGVLSPFWE